VVDDNYIQSANSPSRIERSNSEQNLGEFELLKKESLQNDKGILVEQMKRLLMSESISIEEKGYLI